MSGELMSGELQPPDLRRELDLAAEAIDLVRAAVGPAAEAEALVGRHELALTRFANSYVHQNVASTVTTVRLRIHRNGRTATASTNVAHDRSLRELVDRLLAMTRMAPVDRGGPGLAEPAAVRATGPVDGLTAAATPADRAAVVRAFVDAAGGLSTAGYCRTESWRGAFANSAGQAVFDATTRAAFDGLVRAVPPGNGRPSNRAGTADVPSIPVKLAAPAAGPPAGVARLASHRLADLDGTALGLLAAAKARAGARPIDLPPDRYEVVLEPTAVADLLEMLALYGLNGLAVTERRSFAEIGAAQFDPLVTIVDDPTAPGTTGPRFDAEGTVRMPLELVRDGVTSAVAHDRRTAAMLGTESNGRALPGAGSLGPVPVNMRLLPGGDGGDGGDGDGDGDGAADADGVYGPTRDSGPVGPVADASVAALVSRVRRGLLVTDNWYTRVLDPRPLVVTGLTRNGVWLIENGEVTRPVSNLRFTQSYPEALAPGRVLGVGTRAVCLPESGGLAAFSTPAVHLASWNYTGGAAG